MKKNPKMTMEYTYIEPGTNKEKKITIKYHHLKQRKKNELTTVYTYIEPGRKKEKKMTVTYIYLEPEKEDQEQRVHKAYEPIFEEVLKEWNQRIVNDSTHKGKKT